MALEAAGPGHQLQVHDREGLMAATTHGGAGAGRRVALYARVSTLDQEPENQVQELRRYADARGWAAVEYVDRGVSGAKDRRPALDKLVRDATRRKFDVVICWRLDRLGRNLKHLITLLEQFQSLGVAFVSLAEGIDATTPAGKLQMHILGAIAEFDGAGSSNASRQDSRGRKHKASDWAVDPAGFRTNGSRRSPRCHCAMLASSSESAAPLFNGGELPDALWNLIELLLPIPPPRPKGGRPRVPDRVSHRHPFRAAQRDFLADVKLGLVSPPLLPVHAAQTCSANLACWGVPRRQLAQKRPTASGTGFPIPPYIICSGMTDDADGS
jgi:DNA invertase Pin-like site-specific DNA recombinase